MMTSSNGNIFRVTGPLLGEFTGHRWIPLTKASNAVMFLWSAPEQNFEWTIDLRRHRANYDAIVMHEGFCTPVLYIVFARFIYIPNDHGWWWHGDATT